MTRPYVVDVDTGELQLPAPAARTARAQYGFPDCLRASATRIFEWAESCQQVGQGRESRVLRAFSKSNVEDELSRRIF